MTVTAAEDADAQNGVATVTHSARGGGYVGVAFGSVAVTIVDDDTGSVPQVGRSRVRGETVSIVFDQGLDQSSVPWTSDFAVDMEGEGIAVERIDVLAVDVAEDVVTLARAVEPGERPAVTYTPGTYPIRSVARIDALGFTVHPVPPAASAGTARSVLLFESAADPARQGFVRPKASTASYSSIPRATSTRSAGYGSSIRARSMRR